jgi:hypothetical protein
MHATHSLFQATNWPMNPFEKLFGKSLSSSSIMEGTIHMRKNLDNIWQQNFGCCDKASWLSLLSDFWLSPTLSISLGFVTPMPITSLILALFLIPPFQFMHKFLFALLGPSSSMEIPSCTLGPLIPNLHMLLDSHVDSWFISAS